MWVSFTMKSSSGDQVFLVRNSKFPAYFSLPGKDIYIYYISDKSIVIILIGKNYLYTISILLYIIGYSAGDSNMYAGITVKAEYLTMKDSDQEPLFPLSPGTKTCRVDCYIQQTLSNNVQWVSLISSCISPTINGLSIHGGENQFSHSILLRPKDTDSSPPAPFHSNNAQIQILSIVPVTGVALNHFMKVLPPSSGPAVVSQIWPDETENNYALFEEVEISMFNVHVSTPVQVNSEGVQFEYNAQIFGDVDAHISVNSISEADWDERMFNFSVDIGQDQSFIEKLESKFRQAVSDRINTLSNRLSNLEKAKQSVYELLVKQGEVVDQSNSTFNSYSSQFVEQLEVIKSYQENYQAALLTYNQSKPVSNDIYENLKSVCDVQFCDAKCLSLPNLEVHDNFDTMNEWSPIEKSIIQNYVNEVTGLSFEEQWVVDNKCRPITLIKDWGEAAVGQECSNQSVEKEISTFKTSTVLENERIPAYKQSVVRGYSYRDDIILVTDNQCGMNITNTACLYGNTVCITIWKLIQNSSADAQKAAMSPLIDLAVVQSALLEAKIKLMQLEKQMEVANFHHQLEKRTYNSLHELYQSTSDNFESLETELNDFKSVINPYSIDQFDIKEMWIGAIIKDQPVDVVQMQFKFSLPPIGIQTIKMDVDVTLPLSMMNDLITDNIFNSVFTVPQNSQLYPISSHTQFFTHKCSLIWSAEELVSQVIEVITHQDQMVSTTHANITASFAKQDIFDAEYNITNINFESIEDIFPFSISEELVLTKVEGAFVLPELKKDLAKIQELLKSVLDSNRRQRFNMLLNALDTLYIPGKIESFNGATCYGYFDCFKLIDSFMNKLYKKTPVKSAIYAGYFDSSNAFNVSQFLFDMNAATIALASLTNYWCADRPYFSPFSDISGVMHIGQSHNISCSENLHSSLPITYKWRKNGFYLPKELSESLKIETVSALDSGWYQCVASNDVGSSKSSIWSLTSVEYPIKIIGHPKDTYTFEGNDNGAVFSCNASVQTGSAYSWFYSKYGQDWKLIGNSSNELIVVDPMKDSEGLYRCTVTSGSIKINSNEGILRVLHTSISTLQQEIKFTLDMNVSFFEMLGDDSKASILSQLNSIFKPQYTNIQVANFSLAEEHVEVSLLLEAEYKYIPAVSLLVQAKEASLYKNDLISVTKHLTSLIETEQLILKFGNSLCGIEQGSLWIGEIWYSCPPGSALQMNNFLCGKLMKMLRRENIVSEFIHFVIMHSKLLTRAIW